jgi:hypothetical protein
VQNNSTPFNYNGVLASTVTDSVIVASGIFCSEHRAVLLSKIPLRGRAAATHRYALEARKFQL